VVRTLIGASRVQPPPADAVVVDATGDKRELYRGFGDGYTRAFELAVTPMIFGFFGYLLDRWLGMVPVLTTVFALVALVGLLLRTWFGYVYKMQSLEKAGPWARQ
jgi:F0F1-type ATP synthase assembly protein I